MNLKVSCEFWSEIVVKIKMYLLPLEKRVINKLTN